MEKWKAIKGYEGLYEVSSLGKVRSLDHYDSMGRFQAGRVLSLKKNKNGYLECNLHLDGKGKMFRVHRLVAMAFIPNEDNCPQVNHIDEDKTNNAANNLEWCSAKYNSNYGHARQKNLEGQRCVKVRQLSMNGEIISEYYSMREAERVTGVHNSCISKVIAGKTKQAGGYIWQEAIQEK